MRKALRPTAVLLSSFFTVSVGCGLITSDPEDEAKPANTAGNAGSSGSGINVGANGGESGGGGAGGDDGSSAPPACIELAELGDCGTTSVEAEYRTANILLVIDKSGSMTDQPEGFDTDKWEALKAALDESLHDVAGEVNFGLLLYPYSLDHEIPLTGCTDDCCDVPPDVSAVNVAVQPGAESVPQILEALDDTEPGGGTPTAAALQGAYEYFVNGEGASLKGDRYVLLATDGGPNCNEDNTCDGDRCTTNLDGDCSNDNCCQGVGAGCLDDESVVAKIEALQEEGIPTFVIGIPGTEVYASYLDTFATAGGVTNPDAPPEYYAVEATGGVQALAQTFTDITTHLVRSCEIELAKEPPRLDLVNVAVDCELVPSEDGAAWEIPADNPTQLLLKGNACTYIEDQGARRVDVVYGCPTLR